MTRRITALAVWLLAAAPVLARAGERVVLLPFDNAARAPSARDVVMPAVEAALATKGYDVVTGSQVQQFLRARRIRFLDSLSARHVRELTAELRADAVVSGSILLYGGTGDAPEVVVAARVQGSDGAPLWDDLVALSAASTERAFSLGRVRSREELAGVAVHKLFASWTEAPRQRPSTRHSPGAWARVYRWRPGVGERLTICVLPFRNLTTDPFAPRVLDAVLHREVSVRDDMTAITPAELRGTLVEGGFSAPSVLSPERLREFGRAVGTPLFLKGTIMTYGGRSAATGPAVELHLTLVDVETERIVWSGLHRRTGSDYERLLRRGALPDVASVARRTIAELLDSFTRPCLTMEEGCGSYLYLQECCSQ
jgi:hypothetical protein